MGIFDKLKAGLLKTKESMISKFEMVINSFTKIDEELFEQLEETMIMSDIGVETSLEICEQLRKKIKERGITEPSKIMNLIEEIISNMMGDDHALDLSTSPSIIMVIGVNGAGKTTTIGKLCYQLKSEGKKVIVAAADTFRAAAIEQLKVWTDRAGVDLIRHSEGSDPASVIFDAIDAAKSRKCDVLICDTAGRLHNKKNLMNELAKINRIINERAEGCAKEILLVLDATTGQNAVNQARMFKEVAEITGIVLTKLDGTAKGGIVISIKNELDIPVKLIGVGEKVEDLQPFDSKMFVQALFGDTKDNLGITKEEFDDINPQLEKEEIKETQENLSEDIEEAIAREALEEEKDTEEIQEHSKPAVDIAEEEKVKPKFEVNIENFDDDTAEIDEEAQEIEIEEKETKPKKKSFGWFGRNNKETTEVFEEPAEEIETEKNEQLEEAELIEETESEEEKPKKKGFGWFKRNKK